MPPSFRTLQSHVLRMACMFKNRDCIEKAMQLFRMWKEDPSNHTMYVRWTARSSFVKGLKYGLHDSPFFSIPPDLRPTVYFTTMENSFDVDDFVFLVSQHSQVQQTYLVPRDVIQSRIKRCVSCVSGDR